MTGGLLSARRIADAPAAFLRRAPAGGRATLDFRPVAWGSADELIGYARSMVRIEDADVVAKSGKTHHPIVAYSGAGGDRVAGMVFEITDAELAAADSYEVDAYKRVLAPLASGRSAWVYVDARRAPLDDANAPGR